MSGWLAGLIAGMGFGMALQAMMMLSERRRTRWHLEQLLEHGPFRLLSSDGQPAPCANLITALDSRLHLPATVALKRRRYLLVVITTVVFFVGAFIGAGVLLRAK